MRPNVPVRLAAFAVALTLAARAWAAEPVTAPQVFEKFQQIATDLLWPGYRPAEYPLAIYDGEQTWLFRHPEAPAPFRPAPGLPGAAVMPGRHELVVANSSAELGGHTIGTVMMSAMRESSAERIAAVAVHECFHAFQRTHHPGWSGNEALLFVYPLEDATGFALRRLEERCLRSALAAGDDDESAGWADAALALRSERFERLSAELVGYERNSELNEGLATYVEYRSIAADPLEKLPSAGYPLAKVRDRVYGTGLALAWLLDRFAPDWKDATRGPEFRSLDEHLSQALAERARSGPARLSELTDERGAALEAAEETVVAFRRELVQRRDEYLARPGPRIVLQAPADSALMLQGFDPLNVLRLSDGEILHSRYLALSGAGCVLELEGQAAISTAVGPHPLFNGVRELQICGLAAPPVIAPGADGARVLTAPHVRIEFQRGAVEVSGDLTTIRLGGEK